MIIDGALYEVAVSEYDGKPIKNKLPEELRNKFMTKKQWLEEEKTLKEGAIEYQMHPNAMNKKLCVYYFEGDTVPLSDAVKICANCSIRGTSRYCVVAGDFVNMEGHCSEWN